MHPGGSKQEKGLRFLCARGAAWAEHREVSETLGGFVASTFWLIALALALFWPWRELGGMALAEQLPGVHVGLGSEHGSSLFQPFKP